MKLDEVMKGTYLHFSAEDFLHAEFFNQQYPIVIDKIAGNMDDVAKRIIEFFGDVDVIAEVEGKDVVVAASELCGKCVDTVIIEARPLTERKRFGYSDFVEVLKRLRQPDGCEWDRAQTHETIRINLIEEAYELVEAIDAKNAEMMREECGDVLMQAIFHTQIAAENGEFTYSDMYTELCRKLIDRHTHIFGSNHANNPEEALAFWTEAKKKEKKYKSTADAMDRIPKNLPSLLYAEKTQKLAKKVGFDWSDSSGAENKLIEELDELRSAPADMRTEEGGDLLFAAVNVLRFYKVDPEMALREAAQKFLRRFAAVEKEVAASGHEMADLSLEQLDAIWDKVKEKEKR